MSAVANAGLAVGVAVVIGFFTINYEDYRYWRHWARRAMFLGVLAMEVTLGAGGLVSFVIFHGLGAEGSLAAAIEGGVGYALLRTPIERVTPETDRNVRSALRLINDWVLSLLDARAETGVEKFVHNLSDADLIAVAFDLFHRRFDMMDEVAQSLHDSLEQAAHDLRAGDPTTIADGRGRLRGFCIRDIKARRVVAANS